MVASSSSKQLSCERCARPHSGTYGSSRFCSVRCAKQVGAAARRASAAMNASVTAMVQVPSARPRPIPMRSPPVNSSAASSPPRKKAARSDSPTTIAIAINAKPSISQQPSASSPVAPAVRLRCESCDKPHDGSYGSGRFCAVHCARRTAAALKWSKKRATRAQNQNRSAHTSASSLSAPVAAASTVPTGTLSALPTLAMVHPSAVLPPIPSDDLSHALGKRSHPSVVAPVPHPHPHVFPFPYAPPPCTAHAIMQPHFANAYPYTTPMGRPTGPVSQPRLGEPTQQQSRLSPTPYPVSYPMPIPIAVPVASCYGYPPSTVPVAYGASPYVPVHYGPVGVPSVAHSTSPIMSSSMTVKSQSDISVSQTSKKEDSAVNTKEEDVSVTVKARNDDSGEKAGSGKAEKKSEEDSAAAAEVLMSMFHKKAP